jgi:hypothetical protein
VGQSGLANNTTRFLSVRFRIGTSPNFNFSTVSSTSQTTLPPPPPPTPTDLTITNITQNSATASWTQVQTANQGYDVRVQPGNLIFSTFSSGANSVSLTGLSQGTNYTAEVRSVGTGGISSYSSPVAFTTLFGTPSAPTFAELESTGGGGYLIQWNTGTNATSYDVQLATSSNFATQSLRLDLNPNTVLITGLSYSGTDTQIIGQTVYARVRSRNPSGVSAWKVADPVTGVVL